MPRKKNCSPFATPVVDSREGAIRPGELLVEASVPGSVVETLRRLGGSEYRPKEQDSGDWRQRPDAPDYGRLGDRLAEMTGLRLWTGFRNGVEVRLARQDGLHLNHVFFGLDFYQGGPGGPVRPAEGPATQPKSPAQVEDDRPADVVVLDTGLPAAWESWHGELSPLLQPISVKGDIDRLDENRDHFLDHEAGHGLFISGLISRVDPDLAVDLGRVLYATGEGDEHLIATYLAEVLKSPVAVVNLSLGAFIPNNPDPAIAQVVRLLIKAGKVVVAAAGNAGDEPAYVEDTMFPASMPEVIAVGAATTRKRKQEPKNWSKSNPADVYAPGVDVLSTYVEWAAAPEPTFKMWARWSGTSFATPVVAATIAGLQKTAPAGTDAAELAREWIKSLPETSWPVKAFGEFGAARLFLPEVDLTRWPTA
jgi:hypothetical protein